MANPVQSKNATKAQIFLGLLIFGVIFGTFFASSPAFAQDDVNAPPPSNTSTLDANENRIQGLESAIRDLTGRMEQQDFQIRQLKEQIDKLTNDVDMRLNDLQKGGGSSGGSFNAAPIHNGSNDAPGGTQYHSNSDTQPQPENGAPSGYQWKSGSANPGQGPGPSGNSSDKTQQLGTLTESGDTGAVNPSADTAATLYENAFGLLKGGQYDEAEKEFKSFLGQYPDHALAGNATYWLGETYYVRGQFDKAAKTFAQGYQKDPKGPKAADNLLKMGMSLSGLGKKDEACVALGQINKDFTATAGPVLTRAKQEMTRLGC